MFGPNYYRANDNTSKSVSEYNAFSPPYLDKVYPIPTFYFLSILNSISNRAPGRRANISDALDVPITDASPRTNNAQSTINTPRLPQYASSLLLCLTLQQRHPA
ncbi:hypothetical protein M0804_014139 [Polistes exclamans]|nr:hypothetical protein M0804_014141 [Polistes exclamans]KAI4475700.1 hypothetical protein M0804_014139 [Polistes exclamans]